MADGLLENIFNIKDALYQQYPYTPGIPYFDLERKHAFYGKIDRESDLIFLDTNFIGQIESVNGSSAFVMDVVADAFYSLRRNYRKTMSAISRGSVYHNSLKAYKSALGYTLDLSYNEYIKIIYANFVDLHLSKNRRYEKVTNYREFVKEFIRYALKTITNYPITNSGFISSFHCKPYVSGLMIETSARKHGIENNKNIIQYLQDPYYSFWAKEVQKFGFMVDRNAPWRLVFNVGSGWEMSKKDPDNLKGAQLFLSRYGLNYENVFDFRFEKAYKYDLIFLKNIMETMYASFYRQFSTYEKETATFDKSGRCASVHYEYTRENREPPYEFTGFIDEDDEYWMRVLIKLRFAETKYQHTKYDLEYHINMAIQKIRLFGVENALRYINGLTKGFHVTKFTIEGGYWQGQSKLQYDQRIQNRKEKIENSQDSDYTITGTKNIVR